MPLRRQIHFNDARYWLVAARHLSRCGEHMAACRALAEYLKALARGVIKRAVE